MNSLNSHLIAFLAAVCTGLALTQQLNATTPIAPSQLKGTLNTRNVDSSSNFALCPNKVSKIFENATPHGDDKAGIFEEYSSIDVDSSGEVDLSSCVTACCEKERRHNQTCNVVFVFKNKCYHVRCVSNEACLPKKRNQIKERLQMILVNPVRSHGSNDENITWFDVLQKSAKSVSAEAVFSADSPLSFWKQPRKLHFATANKEPASAYDDDEDNDFQIAEKRMKQILMAPAGDVDSIMPDDLAMYGPNAADASPTLTKYTQCALDLLNAANGCSNREECIPVHRGEIITGVCKCISGYIRNQLNDCVPQELDYPLFDESGAHHMVMAASASEPLPYVGRSQQEFQQIISDSGAIKNETNNKLTVTVESKEVRLPEKEVTLKAIAVPSEEANGQLKYKYLWTLVTQPKGPMNGTISDQSNSQVNLSNLSEGLYTFKVSVTGTNGTYGEATANVTVLPEKRVNRVPRVVITPRVQSIRQPTTNAILDGSTNNDDNIVNWHWEVVSGPIGYQPKLPEVNTLQLADLTSPGNYTFKLTVTDADNMTNSTTAIISVLKDTDYPPVANAGDAVVLYLPNNNVTLNGTASSDDHEIVAWEWTKDANDEAKAVDMQKTRTPYVQLSNLEEGMYTFVLKVTDGSGQSNSAQVHVFVKPPSNLPPVAKAGANATVVLPRNWAVLNGSGSVDDIRIQSFVWKQMSGPNSAHIKNSNATFANATTLTLGLYEFELHVTDENNNTASDSVWVKVVQEKNAAPVANAGGDQSVTLPISALYLNGTNSSDDLAVVKYTWTRDGTSLAAGLVVGDTDQQPVLILTNLVPGHYIFKLTVSDEQGLTSTDAVSVKVQPDPKLMNLVQLTLPKSVSSLTQSELDSVVQKIGLIVGDNKICVRDLKYDSRTEASILEFYVEDGKSNAIDGFNVERMLKEKLQRDASILGPVFVEVRSTVCQNKCSGHGVCDVDSRVCICEAFWMPSLLYYWGFDEANCDWSILYVFVGVIILLLLLSSIFWALACACKVSKKPRARPKVQKYSLIGTQDEEAPHFCRTTSLTDSETDSDVLFETRTKSNGILRANGAAKKKHSHGQSSKYAVTKMGRKVKT